VATSRDLRLARRAAAVNLCVPLPRIFDDLSALRDAMLVCVTCRERDRERGREGGREREREGGTGGGVE